MSPTLTEQVQTLIEMAHKQAIETGTRQRVEAVWEGRGFWYYRTRETAAWPRRLVLYSRMGQS